MLGFQIWKFSFIIGNFIILYFLLKKLFFKKLMDIMEERRQNVAEAVGKIDTAKSEVEEIKKSGEEVLAKAREDAQLITRKAKKTADDLIAQTKTEADKMIQETRAGIEREREEIRQEMYSTLIDLVSMAARKVMSQVISEQQQQKLVETAVKESWAQKSGKGSSV